MDVNDNILSLTYSDQYGNFDFVNLAYGTYKIYAEITGMVSNTITISIDQNNPLSTPVNMIVTNNEIIIGIGEIFPNSISYFGNVYPNPVMDIANIEIFISSRTEIRFEIFNRLGQLLQFQRHALFSGKHIIPINLGELSNGMYFLKVISDDGSSFVRKFIKAEAD